MKFKFIQVLTVCLVTVLVLSPELVVFSMVWEQHMEIVQIKGLVCEANQSRTSPVGLALVQEGEKSAQDQSNLQFSTTNVNKYPINTNQHKIVKTLQWFFLLFPIFLGILIIIYDRYLIYRAAVFQQQVEMLEKLWQQGIEQ